jgi:hypothetical protein
MDEQILQNVMDSCPCPMFLYVDLLLYVTRGGVIWGGSRKLFQTIPRNMP